MGNLIEHMLCGCYVERKTQDDIMVIHSQVYPPGIGFDVIYLHWKIPVISDLEKNRCAGGGKSDLRNKSLMKMFNMIDIGEHAGSGVPNIFNVCEDEGWEAPVIEESFDPDRTSLMLKFTQKQAIKTSDKKQAIKTSDKKQAIKTYENMDKIRLYLQEHETAKTSDIAEMLGLSMARTRVLLSEMEDIEPLGTNRTRTYRVRGR